MRRVLTLGAAAVAAVGLASSTAHARTVEYMSKHPLPRKVGRGFCYIDVPHHHDFAPSDPRLYRQIGGQYYFVADPVAFEYEGPRAAYYGAHPVVEANVEFGDPVFCYMRGPHYHWYEPPPRASFELKGGAYWYVGAYPAAFYAERPRYVVVNEAVAPVVYARPVVDVTVVPPGFHGEIVAAGPGWRAQAAVAGPGVYVATPPPPPPTPVQLGVAIGVNVGGPPAVIERRPIHEVRDRHDHGKHRGWERHPAPPAPHRGGWRGGPAPAPGGGWRGGAAPAPARTSSSWRGTPPPAPGGGERRKHTGPGWKR